MHRTWVHPIYRRFVLLNRILRPPLYVLFPSENQGSGDKGE